MVASVSAQSRKIFYKEIFLKFLKKFWQHISFHQIAYFVQPIFYKVSLNYKDAMGNDFSLKNLCKTYLVTLFKI